MLSIHHHFMNNTQKNLLNLYVLFILVYQSNYLIGFLRQNIHIVFYVVVLVNNYKQNILQILFY